MKRPRPVGRCHELGGDWDGNWAATAHQRCRTGHLESAPPQHEALEREWRAVAQTELRALQERSANGLATRRAHARVVQVQFAERHASREQGGQVALCKKRAREFREPAGRGQPAPSHRAAWVHCVVAQIQHSKLFGLVPPEAQRRPRGRGRPPRPRHQQRRRKVGERRMDFGHLAPRPRQSRAVRAHASRVAARTLRIVNMSSNSSTRRVFSCRLSAVAMCCCKRVSPSPHPSSRAVAMPTPHASLAKVLPPRSTA